MKSFILAGILTLIAASAQAGLLKGPPQIETVGKSFAETNSVSGAKPAVRPMVKPVVKKKHKKRREDEDDDILGKDD